MAKTTEIKSYYEGTVEPIYRTISGAILHLGMFEPGESREKATTRTKQFMASRLELSADTRIVDLGCGYGDAARYLIERFGCRVVGVNLVRVQNRQALNLTKEAGLDGHFQIIEGDFARVSLADECAQVVWSQESFLHAAERLPVLQECARLLAPGGRLIFTDILQTGRMSAREAQLIYERVRVQSLESFPSYEGLVRRAGLEVREVVDLSRFVAPSYQDHVQKLEDHRAALTAAIDAEYVDYTIRAMGRWVRAAQEGKLGWGLFLAVKP